MRSLPLVLGFLLIYAVLLGQVYMEGFNGLTILLIVLLAMFYLACKMILADREQDKP